MRLLLILAPLMAFGLDNAVTVHNWNGTGTGDSRKTTSTQQADRPITISRVFAEGEIPNYPQPYVDGSLVTPWQADVKTRWSDGSVQHAMVSFKATIGANSQIKVDFRNSTDRCSSGNQTACDAAGLDEAEILAFNSGNWGACTAVTAGAPTTYTANARTIVDAGHFTYWLRGPVVTQVVARDYSSTFAYNMGWHWNGSTMAEDASAEYKSLGPAFTLTFYTGWSGVRIRYIVENDFMSRTQDQIYSVDLKSGSSCGTTEYSSSAIHHYARSRWSKVFWDGAQPGDMRFDFNFPYMIYSKVLPTYDTAIPLTMSKVADELTSFNSTDKGEIPDGYGNFDRQMQGGDEGGLAQRQDVFYLYSMDARMWDVLFGGNLSGEGPNLSGGGGEAEEVAHGTFHRREARTTSPPDFCDYSCTGDNLNELSVGHVFSIDAYPSGRSSSMTTPDAVVGTATSNSWSFDPSHMHDRSWIPYLITGNPYYLEEMWFWAANTAGVINQGIISYNRHGYWGYINPYGYQIRGHAWGYRTIGHAWFFAPDGTPEKEYFRKKLQNNIAVDEGRYNITNGSYPPADEACPGYDPSGTSDANRWCWGRQTVDEGFANPLRFLHKGKNASDCVGEGGSNGAADCSLTNMTTASWMGAFVYAAIGHAYELGLTEINGLRTALAENIIGRIVGSGANPNTLFSPYRIAVRPQVNTRELITGVTIATDAVITIAGHGWNTGDKITICCASGSGWKNLNSSTGDGHAITVVDTDTFTIGANTSTASGGWDQTAYAVKASVGDIYSNWTAVTNGMGKPDAIKPFEPYFGGENGYALDSRAAIASVVDVVTPGGLTGTSAYDWALGNVNIVVSLPDNPKWAIIARPSITNIRVSARSTSATVRFDAPSGGACSYTYGTAAPSDTLDSSDIAIPAGNRERQILLSGLSPQTQYSYRITCANARVDGTFSTQ